MYGEERIKPELYRFSDFGWTLTRGATRFLGSYGGGLFGSYSKNSFVDSSENSEGKRSQASPWQVTPLGRCRISQAQKPAQSLGHPDQETQPHSTDSGQNIYKRRLIFYRDPHWRPENNVFLVSYATIFSASRVTQTRLSHIDRHLSKDTLCFF